MNALTVMKMMMVKGGTACLSGKGATNPEPDGVNLKNLKLNGVS